MPYDPRAFPALSPKRPQGPPTGVRPPAVGGVAVEGPRTKDEALVLKKRAILAGRRAKLVWAAAVAAGLGAVALVASVWVATRPPESLPYKPRAITRADLGAWYDVMGVLAKWKQVGSFAGMPSGPLEFARAESAKPEMGYRACREAGADPVTFLVVCDAIGAAMQVEEADRRSDESIGHGFNEAEGPTDVPEALRLEADFGKKGKSLAPPKLSDHLPLTDKENYKLYLENREAILKALESAR